MAAGRAVVASAVGGLLDIVDPGVTGVLVAPDNPAALAEAVEKLFEDRDLLVRMGVAGRDRVKQFTSATVGPRVEAAYTKIIAS
jgi:glycosyltransferase involved in cell wall biosynthesis